MVRLNVLYIHTMYSTYAYRLQLTLQRQWNHGPGRLLGGPDVTKHTDGDRPIDVTNKWTRVCVSKCTRRAVSQVYLNSRRNNSTRCLYQEECELFQGRPSALWRLAIQDLPDRRLSSGFLPLLLCCSQSVVLAIIGVGIFTSRPSSLCSWRTKPPCRQNVVGQVHRRCHP